MSLSRSPVFMVALAAMCSLAPPRAEGLEIRLIRLGTDASGPSSQSGSGTLDAIMRAAADNWQNIISDNSVIEVKYTWDNIADRGTYLPWPINTIKFSSRRTDWFLDSTPHKHEEFLFTQLEGQSFGAGYLNSSRNLNSQVVSQASGKLDLLTYAMHELGHKLGMNFSHESTYIIDAADGYIDITSPRLFAGSRIPTHRISPHFLERESSLTASLMTAGSQPGQRLLPSQVDILAVAEYGGYSRLNLGAVIYTGETVVGGSFVQIGTGRLSIDGGASLTIAQSIMLATSLQTSGEIKVAGPGSALTFVQMNIGGNGRGKLIVDEGARVTGESISAGKVVPNSFAEVTVRNFSDIRLSNSFNLFGGSLLVESGGSLEAAAANFSEGATVNVKGKDSLISAGVIYIGQSGMTTSTVSLSGGGKMSAPNILVFANGVINGVGDAVGNIYYYDAGGKLLPGNSPGTLNIIGNLFLDAGTLELEFDSSERDALNVTGQLRVGSQATIKIFHTGSFASILNFGDFFSGSQPTFQTSFADHAFQVLSSDPAVVGQTVTLSFGAQHRNIEVEFGTPTVTNVPEPGTSVLLLVGLLLIGRAVYAKQRNHDPLSADDKRRSPSVAPAAAAGK